MTVKVKISFDGTDYCGSQIQPNGKTIFGEFQTALIKVLGHKTDIKGCSRTDSGVHARCFYLSFTTDKKLNLHRLPLALNSNLPQDIRVLEAMEEQDDFHARYSAKGKEYCYYIKNSHVDDPFTSKYYYRYPQPLSLEKMQKAAEYFLGTHDFRSFMARKSKITDCVRTVYTAKVTQTGDMIEFKVSADGFLYNMVRIMAGTLIWAGIGRIEPQQVADIIKVENRAAAGVTVPPNGLFLTDVFY